MPLPLSTASWLSRWMRRPVSATTVEDDAADCGTAFGLDLSLSELPWGADTGYPVVGEGGERPAGDQTSISSPAR